MKKLMYFNWNLHICLLAGVSPMDFLALTIKNRQMQSMVAIMEQDIHCLNAKVQDLEKKD